MRRQLSSAPLSQTLLRARFIGRWGSDSTFMLAARLSVTCAVVCSQYDVAAITAKVGDGECAFFGENCSPFYDVPLGHHSCYCDQVLVSRVCTGHWWAVLCMCGIVHRVASFLSTALLSSGRSGVSKRVWRPF